MAKTVHARLEFGRGERDKPFEWGNSEKHRNFDDWEWEHAEPAQIDDHKAWWGSKKHNKFVMPPELRHEFPDHIAHLQEQIRAKKHVIDALIKEKSPMSVIMNGVDISRLYTRISSELYRASQKKWRLVSSNDPNAENPKESLFDQQMVGDLTSSQVIASELHKINYLLNRSVVGIRHKVREPKNPVLLRGSPAETLPLIQCIKCLLSQKKRFFRYLTLYMDFILHRSKEPKPQIMKTVYEGIRQLKHMESQLQRDIEAWKASKA